MKNPNSYSYQNHSPIEYNDTNSDEDEDNRDHTFPQNGNLQHNNDEGSKRHPKKRKLESFVSSYEFAPKRDNWSEQEIYILLEVWGDRYMELGRRSLRAEDWADVAEKVSEMGRVDKQEVDCRTQLDVLKNKYKKERAKLESGHGSKWVFFNKMDGLLSVRNRGHCGLGCGVDSGEYVFMNPRVYLDRSNVMDEMRDSPGESDEGSDEDEGGGEAGGGEEAKALADSIARFGEIYETIEESKRKQMVELERMREEFHRELELQKKEIVERAQDEIAKIREMDDDDDDDDDDDEDGDDVEGLAD